MIVLVDPTSRALRLLARLQGGLPRTAHDLARRLRATTRTVRRDVTRLRDLGYAVEATSGPGSAYRLTGGTRLPPLLLDADEVTALVAGLQLLRTGLPDDDAADRPSPRSTRCCRRTCVVGPRRPAR